MAPYERGGRETARAEAGGAKGASVDENFEEGPMLDAQTSTSVSLQPLKVAERAKRASDARFNSLAHLIDVTALGRAYRRMRKAAAVGVDGMTKEAYGENLDERLVDLHSRLVSKKYRHQAIRRVHIPKWTR